MKILTQTLKQENLSINELPEEVKSGIENLNELIKKYNETVDEYEAQDEVDKEVEKKLDEMGHQCAELETELVQDVKNFSATKKQQEAQAQAQAGQKVSADGDKKKSNWGWLVFAGFAAAITFGAVKLARKK